MDLLGDLEASRWRGREGTAEKIKTATEFGLRREGKE